MLLQCRAWSAVAAWRCHARRWIWITLRRRHVLWGRAISTRATEWRRRVLVITISRRRRRILMHWRINWRMLCPRRRSRSLQSTSLHRQHEGEGLLRIRRKATEISTICVLSRLYPKVVHQKAMHRRHVGRTYREDSRIIWHSTWRWFNLLRSLLDFEIFYI